MSKCSFDIFDTLLTRPVLDPSEIFRVCGERAVKYGWLEISPLEFQNIRVKARGRSCLFAEGREDTINEIYREIADTINLSEEIIHKIKALEIEIEVEYLIPVPKALQMVLEARRSHPNVLFLSDMYLPESFLQERLKQHGFWQEGDRLYVSSQWRKSKGQGDLFLKVV